MRRLIFLIFVGLFSGVSYSINLESKFDHFTVAFLGDLDSDEEVDRVALLKKVSLLSPQFIFALGGILPLMDKDVRAESELYHYLKNTSLPLIVIPQKNEFSYLEKLSLFSELLKLERQINGFHFKYKNHLFLFLPASPDQGNSLAQIQLDWLKQFPLESDEVTYHLFTGYPYWSGVEKNQDKQTRSYQSRWSEVESIFAGKKIFAYSAGEKHTLAKESKELNPIHPLQENHYYIIPKFKKKEHEFTLIQFNANGHRPLSIKATEFPLAATRAGLGDNPIELKGEFALSKPFTVTYRVDNPLDHATKVLVAWENGRNWNSTPQKMSLPLAKGQTVVLETRFNYIHSKNRETFPSLPILRLSYEERPQKEPVFIDWSKVIQPYQIKNRPKVVASYRNLQTILDGELREWNFQPSIEHFYHRDGGGVRETRNKLWVSHSENQIKVALLFEITPKQWPIKDMSLWVIRDVGIERIQLLNQQKMTQGVSSKAKMSANYISAEIVLEKRMLKKKELKIGISLQSKSKKQSIQFPPFYQNEPMPYQLADVVYQ